jgi:DNA primase
MSMADLLQELGLRNIRERGEEVWAGCPNHKDSGDSWSINARTGLHSCFGCHYKGDLDQLILDIRRDWTVAQAVALVDQFGVRPSLDDLLDRAETRASTPLQAPERKPRVFVPELALKDYETPPLSQLERRCISPESAAAFGIRWNTRRDAWVLPIRTAGGVLLGWQEKGPAGVRNRPTEMEKSATVFGAERLRSCASLIVVESPLDAAVVHTLGFEHVVATFGAAVSERQMRMCREYADEIVLALDNDTEGTENMARIASGQTWNMKSRMKESTSWSDLVPMRVINYDTMPEKDIGEIAQREPEDARWALQEALSVLHWLPTVSRRNRPAKSRVRVRV